MGAIHELGADYHFYRQSHPEYRRWFVLLDLVWWLVRLLLIAAFVVVCWYAVSWLNPEANFLTSDSKATLIEDKRLSQPAEEIIAPELTEDRMALLNRIASESVVVSPASAELIDLLLSTEQNEPTTVRVESVHVPQFNPVPSAKPVAVQANSNANIVAQPEFVSSTNGLSLRDSGQLVKDIQNREWVMYQSSDSYTVQIALTVNRSFLVSFAKKLPSHLTPAIYPERINKAGDVQYSLSVGSFFDHASGEAALAAMSKDARRYGAHVRAFNVIQSNIAKLNIQ